jgi:hypothetical protein
MYANFAENNYVSATPSSRVSGLGELAKLSTG